MEFPSRHGMYSADGCKNYRCRKKKHIFESQQLMVWKVSGYRYFKNNIAIYLKHLKLLSYKLLFIYIYITFIFRNFGSGTCHCHVAVFKVGMPYAPRSALGLCSLKWDVLSHQGYGKNTEHPGKVNMNYSCQITIFLIGDTFQEISNRTHWMDPLTWVIALAPYLKVRW